MRKNSQKSFAFMDSNDIEFSSINSENLSRTTGKLFKKFDTLR